MALVVTDQNFDEVVLQVEGPVLVDFWASWCGPCRTLAATIDELTDDYKNTSVAIVKVDVDENQDYAGRYAVRSIPTVILFHKGEVVERWVGVQPKSLYQEAIDKLNA